MDGRNPFAPRKETMVETRTLVGIYVGEWNQIPGDLDGGAKWI